MCRHLAYLGPPIALSQLLFDPPHSLEHQSWAPRDMRHGGRMNADGFGVGWYPDAAGGPVRYRRAGPIWSDASLPPLAGATVTGAALAAVRSATAGTPVIETACAPFAGGGHLFSHNGVIAGWPESMTGLAGTLPVRDLLALDAPTDAALLWAMVWHRLRTGDDAATAVLDTVSNVAAVAPGSRLNLLLTDSRTIVATTVGHSLWARHRPCRDVLVSSEPLDDDPAWREVPDRCLVVATVAGIGVTPLTDLAPERGSPPAGHAGPEEARPPGRIGPADARPPDEFGPEDTGPPGHVGPEDARPPGEVDIGDGRCAHGAQTPWTIGVRVDRARAGDVSGRGGSGPPVAP